MEGNIQKKNKDPVCSVIRRVIEVCDKEAELDALRFPLDKSRNRSAYYANVSVRSVTRIHNEARYGFSIFGNKRGRTRRLYSALCMDCLDLTLIANSFRDYYLKFRTVPKCKNFLPHIQSKMFFRYGRSTFLKVFNWLGFQLKATKKRTRGIIWVEKPELVSSRCKYLQEIKKHRRENKKIFYLHETWLDPKLACLKYCQVVVNRLYGDTLKNYLIIINISSNETIISEEFILLNADEVPNNDADSTHLNVIHDWLKDAIIPRLPENSVVVMEETSYYAVESNQPPSKYSCKTEMFKWLSENNIACSLDMNKFELYDLIVAHPPSEKHHNIEKLFTSKGHNLVKFPPLAWDLNPIEWAFTKLKGIIRTKSVGEKITREMLKELILEELHEMKDENLSSYINHVQQLEDEHWKREGLIEDLIDSIALSFKDELDSDDNGTKYDG